MAESIGKRIAFLRQKKGWTQQSLADRLAMSRVAISHIEMDLTIPSERSVILLAGVFKLSPHELVSGTSYPHAKAERLPNQAAAYTDLELALALLKNDLDWLDRLDDQNRRRTHSLRIIQKWRAQVDDWTDQFDDDHETMILLEMQKLLRAVTDQAHHPLK